MGLGGEETKRREGPPPTFGRSISLRFASGSRRSFWDNSWLPVAGGGTKLFFVSTVQEIEKAIEQLPWPQRLKVYRDLPDLIGRTPEDLDWQRAGLEKFFTDDSPEDNVYDSL